jgi:hypothetical protein
LKHGPKRVAVAATLSVVLLIACSKGKPPNPVHGQIVNIKGQSLQLESDRGDKFWFDIDDPTVKVDHLRLHQQERLPVLITWEQRKDRFVATIIADG